MRRSGRRKKRVNYNEDSLFGAMLKQQGRSTEEWYTTTEQKAPPKPVRAAPGWFAGPAVAAPAAPPDAARPKLKKKKRLKEKKKPRKSV